MIPRTVFVTAAVACGLLIAIVLLSMNAERASRLTRLRVERPSEPASGAAASGASTTGVRRAPAPRGSSLGGAGRDRAAPETFVLRAVVTHLGRPVPNARLAVRPDVRSEAAYVGAFEEWKIEVDTGDTEIAPP